MKIKTAEATGAALDWLVAKALGHKVMLGNFGNVIPWTDKFLPTSKEYRRPFRFSTDWSQGGPIIDREKIATEYVREDKRWVASLCYDKRKDLWAIEYGPTPLIAAMRCFVASKLGYEVDVPEELT